MKDWTGRTHRIEITTSAMYDGDTGCKLDGWFNVYGEIDGRRVMLDSPVSAGHLTSARYSMEASLERYLDGQSHPTHYAGKFAHLARK